MGKTLQELGLKEEKLPTAGEDLDDLPTFGSFAPPPPAGPYRFKLPNDLNAVWDLFDYKVNGEDRGQRVKLQLDHEHPLLIVQSPGGKSNGEPYETSLTNGERKRGKDGVEASELDYLLRALGEKKRPDSNPGYARAVQRHAGQEFGADIKYRWICSKGREKRARDSNGQVHVIAGSEGCGEKYYEGDVSKNADGTVPYEVTCSKCGAWLRAFANLDNLRS